MTHPRQRSETETEHRPAAPDVEVPPATDRPVNPEHPEGPEQEDAPEGESTETVQQLLDAWMEEYRDEETPGPRKRELAFCSLKMDQALQTAGLRPDHVKVAEHESGVLGFYIPAANEIYITPLGLGDPSHYAEVLYHEKSHQEGDADEPVAQLRTRQRVGNARRAIYEAEQLKVERTFDVPELMDRYSIKKPREFTDYYLEEEAADRWKQEWKRAIAEKPAPASQYDRHRLFEHVLGDDIRRIREHFKDALPRLYKAATKGKDEYFHEKMIAALDELYEEDRRGEKGKGE